MILLTWCKESATSKKSTRTTSDGSATLQTHRWRKRASFRSPKFNSWSWKRKNWTRRPKNYIERLKLNSRNFPNWTISRTRIFKTSSMHNIHSGLQCCSFNLHPAARFPPDCLQAKIGLNSPFLQQRTLKSSLSTVKLMKKSNPCQDKYL